MELYEAIYKRRTVRKFLEKEVDFDAVKRILEAGNRAPTWNHNRNWSYIVLRTEEEKAYAFEHAKKIAEKFDAEKYLNAPRPYPTTLAPKNVCLRHTEAIYDAEGCTLCDHSCVQIEGAEW